MAILKKNTLRAFNKKARAALDYFKKLPADAVAALKTTISKGNSKIGAAMNVSLLPVRTCAACGHCARYCYDVRDCLRFPGVLWARAKNTFLAMYHREKYFSDIRDAMRRRRKNKYMRFHVGGEIPDADYFEKMVETARMFPDFIVWTYTKYYAVVNDYVLTHGGTRAAAIPENMHIMFSEWDGQPLDNPYNFPVFATRLKNGNKNHPDTWFETMYKCPGKCQICIKARRGCVAGESTYNDEH